MDNIKQQIMVLPNAYSDYSSSRIIGFMINHTLRDFLYLREGKVEYFAADYEKGLDLSKHPRPDIILFDKTETEEEAKAAYSMLTTLNKGSRVFMQLDDEYLDKNELAAYSKVFTYSAEDPLANFFAQKISPRPEGGFTIEIVFQVNPGGRKGLSALFMPTLNRALVFKTAINTNDRKDVLHAVKAFVAGSALSIDSKYISKDISEFVFDGYKEKTAENDEKLAREYEAKVLRRKEFDED